MQAALLANALRSLPAPAQSRSPCSAACAAVDLISSFQLCPPGPPQQVRYTWEYSKVSGPLEVALLLLLQAACFGAYAASLLLPPPQPPPPQQRRSAATALMAAGLLGSGMAAGAWLRLMYLMKALHGEHWALQARFALLPASGLLYGALCAYVLHMLDSTAAGVALLRRAKYRWKEL